MPQVPYNPVPQVAPSQEATPGLQVQASPSAFGSDIAAATQHLGEVTASAGNELFSRGLALQALKNESDAREADTNYMIEAGKLHATFSTLEGKDAVDAAPKYFQDLKDVRAKLRGSLAAPDAQKMFDGSSLSTMSRSIFNGAGYAAAQNKQYNTKTLVAQSEVDANTVADNPQDEGLFNQKLQRAKYNAVQLSDLQGNGPGSPQEKLLTQQATSQLWKNRIVGLSRTQPFEASKMLDANKTQLTEDDYLKVDNVVRNQGRAVGSVNIAQDVYATGQGDDKTPPKPYAQMEQEVRDRAAKLNPDDPILQKDAVTAFHGLYNQQKYAERQELYTNQQTIAAGIQNGAKDIQELRNDPKMAAAIDALPKDKQLAIPGQINRYNDARDKLTNQYDYQRLYGLSNNDVGAFLETDLTKEKLGQSDMRLLQAKQQKLKEQQGSDPRVQHAVAVVRGAMGAQLQALGIYTRTKDNTDDYDHFTGAMQTAIDTWQEDHGKKPSDKDITDTIAPQILQQRAVPGRLWGSTPTPFYTQTVPDKWAEEHTADIIDKGGASPTPEQLYRAYTREQYVKLYGKKGAPSGP